MDFCGLEKKELGLTDDEANTIEEIVKNKKGAVDSMKDLDNQIKVEEDKHGLPSKREKINNLKDSLNKKIKNKEYKESEKKLLEAKKARDESKEKLQSNFNEVDKHLDNSDLQWLKHKKKLHEESLKQEAYINDKMKSVDNSNPTEEVNQYRYDHEMKVARAIRKDPKLIEIRKQINEENKRLAPQIEHNKYVKHTLKNNSDLDHKQNNYEKALNDHINLEKKSGITEIKNNLTKLRKDYKDIAEKNNTLKSLRAEQNKIINDIQDEHSKIAKNLSTGNISTVRRYFAKAKMINDPDYFKNAIMSPTEAHFHNLGNQEFRYKNENLAFSKTKFGENTDLGKRYRKLSDDEKYDMSHAVNKEAIKVYKDRLNDLNKKSVGKPFISDDDLTHIVNIDKNTLISNSDSLDNFIQDIKDNCDLDKFKSMIDEKRKIDNSEISTDKKLNEDSLIDKVVNYNKTTIDEDLKKWKENFKSGTKQSISLSILPFKDYEKASQFIKKYSRHNPLDNYYDYTNNSYAFTHSMNMLFGGNININAIPAHSFKKGFTPEVASAALALKRNSLSLSSEKELKYLKRLGTWKKFLVASKAILLPYFSTVDTAGARVAEYLKNGGLFNRNTLHIKSLMDNINTTVSDLAKNLKGVTSDFVKKSNNEINNSIIASIENKNIYDQISTVQELDPSRIQGNIFKQKFFKGVDAINNRFIMNPLHGQDERTRASVWMQMAKLIKRYDFENPNLSLKDRLSKYGINDNDIKDIKSHIKNIDVGKHLLDIQDVKQKSLRDKLYSLRYNTDLSAVALNSSPITHIIGQNKLLSQSINMFWGYHLKTTRMMWGAIFQNSSILENMNRAGYFIAKTMPANLAINSMMSLMYGQNPFGSAENTTETILSSMLGSMSRLGMIAFSFFRYDGNSFMNGLSNPILNNTKTFAKALVIDNVSYALSQMDGSNKDYKGLDDWAKFASQLMPFGSLAKSGIKWGEYADS